MKFQGRLQTCGRPTCHLKVFFTGTTPWFFCLSSLSYFRHTIRLLIPHSPVMVVSHMRKTHINVSATFYWSLLKCRPIYVAKATSIWQNNRVKKLNSTEIGLWSFWSSEIDLVHMKFPPNLMKTAHIKFCLLRFLLNFYLPTSPKQIYWNLSYKEKTILH